MPAPAAIVDGPLRFPCRKKYRKNRKLGHRGSSRSRRIDAFEPRVTQLAKKERPRKGPLELNRSAADYWLPLCEPDLLPLC